MVKNGLFAYSLFVFLLTLFVLFPKNVLAGKGCCSWHGGQAYCDTSVGRWVCNDGTYSPSCGCAYIPPKLKTTVIPKPATPKPTIKPTVAPTPTPEVLLQTVQTSEPTVAPVVLGTTNNDTKKGFVDLGIFGLAMYGLNKWLGKKPVRTDEEPTTTA